MKKPKLIYVAGPTASGKTAMAIALAKQFKTSILSCDSRQFYREMKIGTAVPTTEELAAVPHFFIQHLSIKDTYTVADYQQEALEKLVDLFKAHDTVIMVGGSGMYADAVREGLDEFPEIDPTIRLQLNAIYEQEGIEILQDLLREHDIRHYQRVDKQNPRRLIRALEICLSSGHPYSTFLGKKTPPDFFTSQTLVIDWSRETLYERINQRVDQMIDMGLEEEAKSLFPDRKYNALQTLGYREWFDHFDGKHGRDKAIEEIKKNTRRYAKRQVTWFKRYPHAIRVTGEDDLKALVNRLDDGK